jgi:hypothetical protein
MIDLDEYLSGNGVPPSRDDADIADVVVSPHESGHPQI